MVFDNTCRRRNLQLLDGFLRSVQWLDSGRSYEAAHSQVEPVKQRRPVD